MAGASTASTVHAEHAILAIFSALSRLLDKNRKGGERSRVPCVPPAFCFPAFPPLSAFRFFPALFRFSAFFSRFFAFRFFLGPFPPFFPAWPENYQKENAYQNYKLRFNAY
jgi:hypothetical protein